MKTAFALLLLAATSWLGQAQEIDAEEDFSLVRREVFTCNQDGTYTCADPCPWIGTLYARRCCR